MTKQSIKKPFPSLLAGFTPETIQRACQLARYFQAQRSENTTRRCRKITKKTRTKAPDLLDQTAETLLEGYLTKMKLKSLKSTIEGAQLKPAELTRLFQSVMQGTPID
jgi:hypothetical protein